MKFSQFQPLYSPVPTSPAWAAFWLSVTGEDHNDTSRALAIELAGGRTDVEGPFARSLMTGGRRGGKSVQSASFAVHQCLFGGHEVALAKSQTGVFAVISPLREQSREILDYARGIVSGKLRNRVLSQTDSSITFKNGTELRVMTCDGLSVRGATLIGCIQDEWAFQPHDGAEPDTSIYAALRPALMPLKGAPMRHMIAITSAFTREGLAFNTYDTQYGVVGAPWFVASASTPTLNPNVDPAWLAELEAESPIAFEREINCAWQDAVSESWFGVSNINRAIHTYEWRPYESGVRYVAALDVAFKRDNTALVIGAHRKDLNAVEIVRVVEFKSPIEPKDIIAGVARILRQYQLTRVFIDQHESTSLKVLLAQHGLVGEERPWTAANKTTKFTGVLQLMKDERLMLPNHTEMRKQLALVSGKARPSGIDIIEARRGKDDIVSALVLCVDECLLMRPTQPWAPGDEARLAAAQRAVGMAIGGGAGGFGVSLAPRISNQVANDLERAALLSGGTNAMTEYMRRNNR